MNSRSLKSHQEFCECHEQSQPNSTDQRLHFKTQMAKGGKLQKQSRRQKNPGLTSLPVLVTEEALLTLGPSADMESRDFSKVPPIPTELVMEIVEYLSVHQLLVKARLINRLWNVIAMDRTRTVVMEWSSKVRSLIPGNVELQYQGNKDKVHNGNGLHFSDDNLNEAAPPPKLPEGCVTSEHGKVTVQFWVKDRVWGSDHRELPRHSFPLVKSVTLYLTDDYLDGDTATEGKGVEKEKTPRLALQFVPSVVPKKYTHTPADTLVLGYREIALPMRVEAIYMDNDSVSNKTTVNLKQIVSEQVGFNFNIVLNIGRWQDADDERCQRRKSCFFLGYEGRLEIAGKVTNRIESSEET